VAQLRAAVEGVLRESSRLTIEYVDLADPVTLEALPESATAKELLITVAVIVDGVRLLDERLLGEDLVDERGGG
jgi:pantothenate synthetase